MPARKPTPERKSRSGPTQEEWDRKGMKVQFRLPELYVDAMVKLAAKEGLPPNILAARIVRDALVDTGHVPAPWAKETEH